MKIRTIGYASPVKNLQNQGDALAARLVELGAGEKIFKLQRKASFDLALAAVNFASAAAAD
ncbi:hypothetical protein [Pseudomonas sp. SCB32]|uniref:hypothetical protein n=1 Tax=Pseudomonas sp. SCB32 TaxID=2653853 RepID=UPI001265799A|nr:hypothetical protein [Pseudomonas sp. SCB32]